MPYKLHIFDGLVLSSLDAVGNLGTGGALTSFEQLPGGGYWDNYGDNVAPQGIRPITLTGIIHEPVASDRVAALDALRGKLGKRGKLSVLLDDGSIRWQWARLLDVNTPRGTEHGTWFPFDLTWVSAAQFWYGATNESWTWGDLSWYFDDGTTTFGADEQSFVMDAVSESVTISNLGNVRARNVAFHITSGANAITTVDIANYANSNYLSWAGTLAASGDTLVIDCGSKSCYQRNSATALTLVEATSLGEYLKFTVTPDSGYTAGSWVYVDGTANYDGEYEVQSTVSSGRVIYCYAKRDYPIVVEAATGTIASITDEYANLNTRDRKNWMYFDAGDNDLIVAANATGATVTVYYYNHYA